MNVREVINELNTTKLQTLNYRAYISILKHAAVFENNFDAQNFLFLCNWKHEQLPN